MAIIPPEHFDYLREERERQEKQGLLAQQQVMNLLLTREVNQAFDEYMRDKDADKFTNRMRALGIKYGNERLQAFEMPDYLTQIDKPKPVYMVTETGELKYLGDFPSKTQFLRNYPPPEKGFDWGETTTPSQQQKTSQTQPIAPQISQGLQRLGQGLGQGLRQGLGQASLGLLDVPFIPFRVMGQMLSRPKSPYPEYPDAFLENGVWKVIRDGKKYRIED